MCSMKKNGFISTSLIYTFFVLFLLLMLLLLNSYSSNRFLIEQYKYDIKNSFALESTADINLFLLAWDEESQDYETVEEIPTVGYLFDSEYSYCVNGSSVSYNGSDILVSASGKDTCYAYFKESDGDIELKIYTQEKQGGPLKLVRNMPNLNYSFTSAECTSPGVITFDETARKFTINSSKKTKCEAIFTKVQNDIVLNIFKESAYGNHIYNGIKYTEVEDIPDYRYTFGDYVCTNKDVSTTIKSVNNELVIESDGKNECNVYYNGDTSKVELIIMMQTDDGVSGYTTGLKYTKTSTIPSTGYKYVGYICDDTNATVTYNNGTFTTNATDQTVCRAYFNRYSGGAFINYYLETSKGGYENVSEVPAVGYVYNKSKSSCNNNSEIIVDNNIVIINSVAEDVCNIYYDLVTADVKVQVFVMNKTTNKYELGSIPVAGYQLYSASCTNGASIQYRSGLLNVSSEGPTVCTVYFR